MPEIKTRETVKDIKILDKASVAGERMKQAFIRSKDTAQNLMDDGQVSPSEYAEDKIKYAAEDVAYDTGIDAEYGDQLLTLSTCEYFYKNGRFVVVAKKVV